MSREILLGKKGDRFICLSYVSQKINLSPLFIFSLNQQVTAELQSKVDADLEFTEGLWLQFILRKFKKSCLRKAIKMPCQIKIMGKATF
ncbi:hypothetical protein BK667_18900 [Pseudomonas frederiksbergensis]|nr:hypothetical protein BK667_18900 [Pseudomonas frederiksbergensis]